MSTITGERKSSRTVKKPDFFAPPAITAVTSRQVSDGSDSDSDAVTGHKKTVKRTIKGKGRNTRRRDEDSDDEGFNQTQVKSNKKGQVKTVTIKINSGSILGMLTLVNT